MRSSLLVTGFVLLCAVNANAQSETKLHYSLAAYMSANGADLSSTMWALGADRGKEVNLIFAPFVKRPAVAGATKMGIASLSSYIFYRIHQTHPKLALVATNIGTVFFSYVAYHNTQVVK